MKVEVFDEQRAAGPRREGGARLHDAVPVDAGRFLERPGRRGSTTPPTSSGIPGVWRHGDYVELTEHDGVIIYGRSDAVLNPGGVRIGTAEIYRQVEQLPEVVESLVDRPALGRRRADRAVRAAAGRPDARPPSSRTASGAGSARTRRRATSRRGSSRSPEIPRTKSGKIVELAVRDVVHGRPVRTAKRWPTPTRSTRSAIAPSFLTRSTGHEQ